MYREPDAFIHQVVGGRWRLLELLCTTAQGAVFRAEALEDGRLARLELWDQRHVESRGELARFEREARTLSRLRNERCLSVVAFGTHEGRPFLASDLPAGRALGDELGRADLTVTRAVSLGLQLCEGLRYLHRHGAVHRALVPDNVWVVQWPATDLVKIGLPRMGQTNHTPDATRAALYLPPERSAARPDHRADLYAVGMLLYVMCTGGEPSGEVLAAIAGGAPVPPPRAVSPGRGISEGLERVIVRAVAPSPDVRFGTADELMAALQSVGVGPTSPKRRPAQRPRNRTATIAATFAAVAVLGAGVLRSSGGKGSSTASAAALATLPPSIPSKAAVEPPAALKAAIAAPPLEPIPQAAPAAVPPRAPQIAATSSGASPQGERSEIWSLLDSGQLDESATRIRRLRSQDPKAAWPRFALGVLYYRRYWRQDAVKQWRLALAQDSRIKSDPQFAAYLCFMLDDSWKTAGVRDLLDQLGAEAVPLLEQCVASAKDPRLRVSASRTLERVRRTAQNSGADHGRP